MLLSVKKRYQGIGWSFSGMWTDPLKKATRQSNMATEILPFTDGGFHKWWYPKNRCFFFPWKIPSRNGWLGGSPILTNLQMISAIKTVIYRGLSIAIPRGYLRTSWLAQIGSVLGSSEIIEHLRTYIIYLNIGHLPHIIDIIKYQILMWNNMNVQIEYIGQI